MAGPRALLAFLAASLVAAGCAAPGPYPSLAPRPAEKAHAEDADERQPTPRPDDPELAAGIVRLTASAQAGEADFEAALSAAQAAVAGAGAAGSDSWIEAQQALSRLESARARTTAALADLDRLGVERASAGTLSDSDRSALSQSTARIQALADAQADRLRQFEARLGRR